MELRKIFQILKIYSSSLSQLIDSSLLKIPCKYTAGMGQ